MPAGSRLSRSLAPEMAFRLGLLRPEGSTVSSTLPCPWPRTARCGESFAGSTARPLQRLTPSQPPACPRGEREPPQVTASSPNSPLHSVDSEVPKKAFGESPGCPQCGCPLTSALPLSPSGVSAHTGPLLTSASLHMHPPQAAGLPTPVLGMGDSHLLEDLAQMSPLRIRVP